jgi:hypothetical protein
LLSKHPTLKNACQADIRASTASRPHAAGCGGAQPARNVCDGAQWAAMSRMAGRYEICPYDHCVHCWLRCSHLFCISPGPYILSFMHCITEACAPSCAHTTAFHLGSRAQPRRNTTCLYACGSGHTKGMCAKLYAHDDVPFGVQGQCPGAGVLGAGGGPFQSQPGEQHAGCGGTQPPRNETR